MIESEQPYLEDNPEIYKGMKIYNEEDYFVIHGINLQPYYESDTDSIGPNPYVNIENGGYIHEIKRYALSIEKKKGFAVHFLDKDGNIEKTYT